MHTEEDLFYRNLILELMTSFELEIPDNILPSLEKHLAPLEKDGLCTLSNNKLQVTELGRPFIRNICMTLDKRMLDKKKACLWSKTLLFRLFSIFFRVFQ